LNEILQVLVRWFAFLWKDGRYRITDSLVSTSFGGDAYLVISSDVLRLRFVRDRGQIFLDFQESWATKKAEWYSVDLVQRLMTGERQNTAEVNAETVLFVRDRLADIESRFGVKDEFRETKTALNALKKARAKEMFS